MTPVTPGPVLEPVADPARQAGFEDPPPRLGLFTDTSMCIGCHACEVACEEWNGLPSASSPDGGAPASGLNGTHWRHVRAVAQWRQAGVQVTTAAQARARLAAEEPATTTPDGRQAAPALAAAPGPADSDGAEPVRWLLSSDVCAHCTLAGCLDVCPTGAIFRSELGTVVVQQDVCNGCGACVPACPYGVIGPRPAGRPAGRPSGAVRRRGVVGKCTLCYDRMLVGTEPACAKACPTGAIQFGTLEDLWARADERLRRLRAAGVAEARLHGRDPGDGVGGAGAFALLLDEPEAYGLPPDPVVPTADLPAMWRAVGWAAATMVAAVGASFAVLRR